ncbi:fibronectin type III domain-containing protein [Flavobacterium azooxidireducens]|uniref:Fibronectin type III domain-containing protein n=1 Tax=Flavobacterium azooxidireducens TaxID=1871076 RepID=A0ABY4KGB3_9FLAO|nr:fibronectin type III domain-containing protein [Flavobacterium azooxidireducens]UPQ79839.1 fibronectin type III domain-containing protein [Flavobacterium azooxidireducens]
MKKIYFLLLILFSVCSFGQNYDYTIYNTSNSGIASNYVGDLKVDANGLLWIASFSGVSTFNGTTFTNYNTGNSGIVSNSILKIQIDGLNRKWMATQSNGISRLNGSTWTNYTTANSGLPNNAINDIAVDGLNNLWVATNSGLSKFNGTTWTTYSSLTNINSVATDSNNGVWVSTGNLLYKFNGTDFDIITDGVQKILRIANNIIYIDSFDALMTYTTAGTFLNLYFQNTSCLAGYQLNALDVDSSNKAWIAFQGEGLQNFTDCISYTSNSGLPDNYISAVRTQSNGTIWAGTLQLGLTKMTPSASTCNAPTQTWSENITSTTATLNWIPAVPAPDSYVIRYNTTNVIGGIQDATASTSISIENLNPNADYYWWVASVCGEQQSNWVLGGFFGTLQATCNPPTNLAVSNITSNSSQITWTPPAPAPSSGYEIYFVTNNVAPSANTTPTFTSTSAGINITNGLTPGTTYYYWVRSNCGSTKSSWVSGGNFNTTTLTGCNAALYGQWPNTNFTPACSGATEQIVVNAYASEFTNVNIVADRQYTFSSSVSTDFITITNDANVILASGTTPLSWASQSTTGMIRYYLHTNANCGAQNTDRIKYIQCVAPVSCGLPTNLAVSNITSNSCRLFWNAPTPAANSYDLYLSTNSTAPVAATNATQVSNANLIATLNGLSASTTYYYWVRSNCNGTRSAWVSGGSFTTVAFSNCNGASYGLYPDATFTPACTGNTELIIANAWAGEYSNVNVLSNKQYTFTSSIATDYVTITNATGTTVFASGVTPLVWNSNATSGLIRYHLHTNANCGIQNTARVRSITCSNASSCNPPTNFGSEVLSSTSAVIGWIPSTSAPNGGYLYVYNTTPVIGGIDGSTGSTSADLTDLLPNTTYYWWVASDCVSSLSEWAYGGSFTTPGSATSCWQTISAGYTHSVGIKTDGTLWAWGDNGYGQLGDATTTSKNTPTQIGSANNWESVSASGGFTIAIKVDGSLWAWGNNTFGQLGDGTTTNRTTPTLIGTANNWKSVTIGEGFALAIKDNGTLWSWGYNNYGQLGDGTTTNRTVPTQVGTATNWQSTAAGSGFSLAIRTNGTLWAWGYNNSGQLGDGTTTNRITPVQIGTENDWANVAAGYAHSVGLKANGILYTWGNNANGQLGDGTTTNKLTPTGVYDQVESIEAGWYYTVGTTTFGNMLICGQNNFGQLGDSTTSDRIWVSATNSTDHLQISAGAFHTLSLHTDGSLKVCGLNGQGRLGDGTTTDRISLTPIACPTNNLGVDDSVAKNSNVKVYPNPVNDILSISFEQGISSVAIYNLLSQEVFSKLINANETTIDVSHLAAGTYLVKVEIDNNEVKTIKLIKK